MSLTLNIFSLGLGFFLLGLSVLALITALWFVSFIGNTMFIATYTSGGK
jgi:hypothetical protein